MPDRTPGICNKRRNFDALQTLDISKMEKCDMKNLIGTAVGAAIDRRDGDSGIKGAILGYFATGAVKTVAKLGLAAAVAVGTYSLARKATGSNAT